MVVAVKVVCHLPTENTWCNGARELHEKSKSQKRLLAMPLRQGKGVLLFKMEKERKTLKDNIHIYIHRIDLK